MGERYMRGNPTEKRDGDKRLSYLRRCCQPERFGKYLAAG
jgi:hypothetical protein